MRRILISIVMIMVAVFFLPGCSSDNKSFKIEKPVTLKQVNSDGKYVARAFLESIFNDDREMFNKCYPDGFVDSLNNSSGSDLFSVYSQLTDINGSLSGTGYAGSKDYTIDNGFDESLMKSRICLTTGIEYSDVEKIQIQKITARFVNSVETVDSDFYFVVYKSGGNWYFLEFFKDDTGF